MEASAPAPPPAFLCDAMLGSLARWLRTLGYDAAYDAAAGDRELLARAARERRTLLTRDTRIPRRGETPPVLLLRSNGGLGQLGELARELRLGPPPGLFTRCLRCNAVLAAATGAQVEARVPDFVRAAGPVFLACPVCRRVYWSGTHRREMLRRLAPVVPGIGSAESEGRRPSSAAPPG
jgi:uncharacterized protein with PIN domain